MKEPATTDTVDTEEQPLFVVRNQGWDLEGQRELETADSGYQPGLGPKVEYQAGYREAFRRAYREGWELP